MAFTVGKTYKRSDNIAPSLRVKVTDVGSDGKVTGEVISGGDGITGFDNMTINVWKESN